MHAHSADLRQTNRVVVVQYDDFPLSAHSRGRRPRGRRFSLDNIILFNLSEVSLVRL
jgi:hypothetical protein